MASAGLRARRCPVYYDGLSLCLRLRLRLSFSLRLRLSLSLTASASLPPIPSFTLKSTVPQP